jgi:hypothetical protein
MIVIHRYRYALFSIAFCLILIIAYGSVQFLLHSGDERPLSVYQQIGASGYPEGTGMAAERIKPMELPISFKVGLIDRTVKSHHYSVELKGGERVRYFFNSSKPINFMIVFSAEKWPDTSYLEPSDVVVANETSISFHEGKFRTHSRGYLSFHFCRSWRWLDPPESSVVHFEGVYLWPFK